MIIIASINKFSALSNIAVTATEQTLKIQPESLIYFQLSTTTGLAMNYQRTSSQENLHSTITHEQLNQVIEAISDGRYSWACVLILRFIGYNPLHFIPQRTYSRLMKEHSQFISAKLDSETSESCSLHSDNSQEEIDNLNKSNYLEKSDTKKGNIPSINVPFYLNSNMDKLYPSKIKELQN